MFTALQLDIVLSWVVILALAALIFGFANWLGKSKHPVLYGLLVLLATIIIGITLILVFC